MNIEWHRTHKTETVTTFPGARRPFLYATPVLRQNISDYLSYPMHETLGVSLSLARVGSVNDRVFVRNPNYEELLAKQLCWFVKHLCEHTDMVQQGVPLRVGITHDMRQVVMPYFEACQFPLEVVDWFDSREDEMFMATKYDAIRQPAWASTDKVLHFDLCFLIGSHPTQTPVDFFATVRRLWNGQHFALMQGLFDPAQLASAAWAKYEANPTIRQKLIKSFGDINQYNGWKAKWKEYAVDGAVWGLSWEKISDTRFWEELEPLLAIHDEMALSIYLYRNNYQKSDVARLTEAFRWHRGEWHTQPHVRRNFWLERDMPIERWVAQHNQPTVNHAPVRLPESNTPDPNTPRSFPQLELKKPKKTHAVIKKFVNKFVKHDPDDNFDAKETGKPPAFYHTTEDLMLYYEIASGLHDAQGATGCIIHAGVYKGASLCAMGLGQQHLGIHFDPIFALDPYENVDDRFNERNLLLAKANIRHFNLNESVFLIDASDVNFFKHITVQARCVFIDTFHSYAQTQAELETFVPMLCDGGWLIFHDYADYCEVPRAVNEFIDATDKKLNIAFYPNATLLIQAFNP